jgi:hypothetical protein
VAVRCVNLDRKKAALPCVKLPDIAKAVGVLSYDYCFLLCHSFRSYVIKRVCLLSTKVASARLFACSHLSCTDLPILTIFRIIRSTSLLLCGLVVRVLGYRSRGPGSISGATRFFEKYWVWNGVQSVS